MNKFLYSSALCIFSLFLGSTASKAVDFPKHYRTLNVTQEYTKSSTDFKAKNLFPFHFPDDLPGTPVFKGATGQFSTTTQANLDENGKDITVSETLFGIEFTTNRCPKAEEVSYAMDQSFPGAHHGLMGYIVKQARGGTQVSNVDFMNPYDIVMDMGKDGCGVVYFDGTDFQNKPYTMKADLQLKYTFKPIVIGLGGEYILGANNRTNPVLNAYSVVPVIAGKGPGGTGVLRPGTVFAIDGNISTAGTYKVNKGHWFVRYIMAVYKNNSCQIAFKNHPATRFSANTPTGIGSALNPTSALWPTATIISDFTVAGQDRDTVIRQLKANNALPIHVEDGDCIVQAALPYGDASTVEGTSMNMESQSHVVYIPD